MKKVAVIGLGNIATRHRRNLKHLFPDVFLYAMSASGRIPAGLVSDSDEIVASLNELIQQKPEMVIVASPAPFHASHAIPLIEAGIPTLIEKPVTVTTQDSECLQKAIESNSTPVAVGYCLRYLSSSIKMKILLEENVIGDIYNSFIQIGQYLPDWRPSKHYQDSVSANKHLGGGALLELSHELDYAQWLFGDLHVEHAILRSSKELDLEVEDMADITLTNGQGMVCNIHLDFLQRSAHRICSFIGSKGRLDWDLIKNKITFTDSKDTRTLYSAPTWNKNRMYIAMLEDFVRMIIGQSHQCIELGAAAKTIQLIENIKKKANRSN